MNDHFAPKPFSRSAHKAGAAEKVDKPRRGRPVTGPYREMIAIGNPRSLRFALVVYSC